MSVYEFWYKVLCDVYLEAIKPIMYGTDETAKNISKTVL